MNTYEYKIILTAKVEAFDESDAWDAIQDAFGIGEQMGVVVTDCEYQEKKKKRK
jgi:hypothetical protein